MRATRSLGAIGSASGREFENPYRKVLRFLFLEGPWQTYRKAKSKVAEKEYSGDYRVTAVLGEDADSGSPIVGLACRVPPFAEYMLLHEALSREVGADFTTARFAAFAAELEARADTIGPLGRQTFLYSGEDPPAALAGAVDDAVGRATGPNGAPRSQSGELAGGTLTLPPESATQAAPDVTLRLSEPAADDIPLALLGAGDYARIEVLPALRRKGASFVAVADREPQIVAQAAKRYGFDVATTDPEAAIRALPGRGVVVVASAHDSHARLAAAGLDAGHRVFLEKPPVVTTTDLELLLRAHGRAPGELEIGFNRRYSKLLYRARRLLADEPGPFTISCIVKEVSVTADHWYLWPNQGTRVTGNLCHWLDAALFLMGGRSAPAEVALSPRAPESRTDEDRTICVTFDDGSVLTIVATGRGDATRGVQETFDVRRGSTTVVVDDLRRLVVLKGGRARTQRTIWRRKGHTDMYSEAITRFKQGRPALYPVSDLVSGAIMQIAASELARTEEGGSAPVGAEVRSFLDLADGYADGALA